MLNPLRILRLSTRQYYTLASSFNNGNYNFDLKNLNNKSLDDLLLEQKCARLQMRQMVLAHHKFKYEYERHYPELRKYSIAIDDRIKELQK